MAIDVHKFHWLPNTVVLQEGIAGPDVLTEVILDYHNSQDFIEAERFSTILSSALIANTMIHKMMRTVKEEDGKI